MAKRYKLPDAASDPVSKHKAQALTSFPMLFDRLKYQQRNIIEHIFGWLKENRRIVTRFNKLAKSLRR